MNNSTQTTCQICGRPIKANRGTIAHHGYKRPDYGWQTASCMGALHLPYEVSRDLIPVAITSLEKYIYNTTVALEGFIKNPPSVLSVKVYSSSRTNKYEDKSKPENFSEKNSIRPYSYESAYHRHKYDMQNGIKSAKLQVEYLQKRYDNWKP